MPRYTGGLVYDGASSSPVSAPENESSPAESGLPSTPGISRVIASIMTMAATSPPAST